MDIETGHLRDRHESGKDLSCGGAIQGGQHGCPVGEPFVELDTGAGIVDLPAVGEGSGLVGGADVADFLNKVGDSRSLPSATSNCRM